MDYIKGDSGNSKEESKSDNKQNSKFPRPEKLFDPSKGTRLVYSELR